MTNNTPFFIEQASSRFPVRSGLEGRLDSDILIVGAGMTGLSTAYALSEKIDPRRITVIDSSRVGFSTSGLSSGLLVDSVEDDYCDVDPKIYAEVQKGVDGIVRTVKKEGLSCDLRNIPSIYVARDDNSQEETVRDEYNARKASNFDVKLLNRVELMLKHGINGELGMKNNVGFCIDPASFCQELARVLESRGVTIFENTKLTEYNEETKLARTNSGYISYQKLILANSNPALDNNPLRQNAMLLSTAVAVTEPLTSVQYEKLFANGEYIAWDAEEVNYMYFRPVGDRQLLIGGSDRLVSRRSQKKLGSNQKKEEQDRINVRKLFESVFPKLKDVKFSNEWTGVIPASVDSNPVIGEITPDHYVGLYNPGLPNAFRAGEFLADLVIGQTPESYDLFRQDRKIPLTNRIRALSQFEPATTIANKLYFS